MDLGAEIPPWGSCTEDALLGKQGSWVLSPSLGAGSLQKEQTLAWQGWEQPNPALGSAQSARLLPG